MVDRGDPPNIDPKGPNEVAAPSVAKPVPGLSDKLTAALRGMNVPIDFWGQVVDQDGNGVEGAMVKMRLDRGDAALGRGTSDTLEAMSDAGGRFSFTGLKGFRISLESAGKEGYRLASRQDLTLDYRGGEGAEISAANARQYVLIETGNEVSLFYAKHRLFSEWEGEPLFLDLRKGMVDAGPSDLTIVATRQAAKDNLYDWEFSIACGNGGGIALVEPGPPPTVAPVEGYQGEWSTGYMHDDADYHGGGGWDFFVRMPDGNYARVQLTAYIDARRTNANLILRVFINEAGGRVLEDATSNSRY
jgi:hypothetical protein